MERTYLFHAERQERARSLQHRNTLSSIVISHDIPCCIPSHPYAGPSLVVWLLLVQSIARKYNLASAHLAKLIPLIPGLYLCISRRALLVPGPEQRLTMLSLRSFHIDIQASMPIAHVCWDTAGKIFFVKTLYGALFVYTYAHVVEFWPPQNSVQPQHLPPV
jgi:hypothetical protein